MKNLILATILLLSAHINPKMVRHGNLSDFNPENQDKIGVVTSLEVYERLPSVIIIKKEKIKVGSARYNELMTIATNNYKKILKAVAREKNLVLIVENGGVRDYPTIYVTKDCINRIQ
jgi:hypothetical protein|tara:strand:+ start:227 stop:580 length:354 start_codon:yes stop_codon:yes gene_type:complete